MEIKKAMMDVICECASQKKRVIVYLINGFQYNYGTILEVYYNGIKLLVDGEEYLIYDHAISTVKPVK